MPNVLHNTCAIELHIIYVGDAGHPEILFVYNAEH